MARLFILLLIFSYISVCQAGEMFKYKDAKGNWVFSDKPPEKEQKFSTLQYSTVKKPTAKIKLYNIQGKQGYTLHAKNEFYSPIEIGFTSPFNQAFISKVIPAQGSIALLESKTNTNLIKFLPYSELHW
jgi:hypothetical protein